MFFKPIFDSIIFFVSWEIFLFIVFSVVFVVKEEVVLLLLLFVVIVDLVDDVIQFVFLLKLFVRSDAV